jgi:hypothetical protein
MLDRSTDELAPVAVTGVDDAACVEDVATTAAGAVAFAAGRPEHPVSAPPATTETRMIAPTNARRIT